MQPDDTLVVPILRRTHPHGGGECLDLFYLFLNNGWVMKRRCLWFGSMMTVLIVGCGAQPTQAPRPASPLATAPPIAPLPSSDPVSQTRLQQLLAAIGPAGEQFETVYNLEERRGNDYRKTSYRMRFRKSPRVSWMEVLESSHLPKGFKVRDVGQDKVSVRLPGVLRFINLDVSARSEQSKTLLGLYPPDFTPDRFTAAARRPDARVLERPESIQEGRRLRIFDVESPQAPIPGAQMVLGVGAAPDYVYYLALRRKDGASLTQRFTQFRVRRFTEAELTL